MSTIADIIAREILDSRGNPTVEVDVILDNGVIGRAAVPSGASTGAHEAVELRDGDAKRYGGKGALKAIANIHGPILDAIGGSDPPQQLRIHNPMIPPDGPPTKPTPAAHPPPTISPPAAPTPAAA